MREWRPLLLVLVRAKAACPSTKFITETGPIRGGKRSQAICACPPLSWAAQLTVQFPESLSNGAA
jgi:hypothetical protein